MYYGMVLVAVVLFGLQFFCNEKYQQEKGSGLAASMLFILGGGLAGLLILWLINGFQLHCTSFTFWMAFANAVSGMLFSLCGLKALGKINLSLYSLFSMLGGMALPFVVGILFYGESLTWGKGICMVLVMASLLLTLEKGSSKGGGLYYAGIFIFNGMSGVLSKVFQDAPFAKASAADYSIWSALITVALAGGVLLCLKKPDLRLSLKGAIWVAGNGILNRFANYLLLLALVHLPASTQYPMITGGVMVVSTLLSYCTPKKPKAREWAALALSFIGILFLFF